MRTHAIASLAALLALAGCSPQFDGPEKVKGLRILAVKAEPPEIGATGEGSGSTWPEPGAGIEALIGHPAFAAGDDDVHAVLLHLACTPTPGDPVGTICTQMSALSEPSQLLQLASFATACSDPPHAGVVNAVTFSGLEACNRGGCAPLSVRSNPADPSSAASFDAPTYQLPADFSLSALAAGHTQRVLGTDVVVLSLAVEAAAEDVAPAAAVDPGCETLLPAVLQRFAEQWPLRSHVASLKWIHVRGPDMPADSDPNENPQVAGISLGGTTLPLLGAEPQPAVAGQTKDLLPVLPGAFDDLRQTYQRFDTNAVHVDTREEDWAYSWFATAGEIDKSHTTRWDEKNPYQLKSGRAMIWLVVRDLRGGETWTAGEVQVPPAP